MTGLQYPTIYRRLVAPSRGRANRIGSHRIGRFEDRQAGPEPEVDSWRDIISSEAVLGRLEALQEAGSRGSDVSMPGNASAIPGRT